MLGATVLTMTEPAKWDRLTPQSYAALRSAGKTKADIARYFSVSRQAVSDMLRRHGIDDREPRRVILDDYPFGTMSGAHSDAHINRMLRNHGVFMATGALPRTVKRELFKFYAHLRDNNLIVVFDPENGGWSYDERTRKDGDMLFRINRFIVRPLTEKDMVIWAFPPDEML